MICPVLESVTIYVTYLIMDDTYLTKVSYNLAVTKANIQMPGIAERSNIYAHHK